VLERPAAGCEVGPASPAGPFWLVRCEGPDQTLERFGLFGPITNGLLARTAGGISVQSRGHSTQGHAHAEVELGLCWHVRGS
jgi:hypothetical protein